MITFCFKNAKIQFAFLDSKERNPIFSVASPQTHARLYIAIWELRSRVFGSSDMKRNSRVLCTDNGEKHKGKLEVRCQLP